LQILKPTGKHLGLEVSSVVEHNKVLDLIPTTKKKEQTNKERQLSPTKCNFLVQAYNPSPWNAKAREI
jgi:hypothetical protein